MGVIQQSLLHYSRNMSVNLPGLPDVVMLTDGGMVPPCGHHRIWN